MSWKALLAGAVSTLRAAGVDGAARDARLLLAHARGIAPDRMILEMEGAADPAVADRFQALVARRAAREPLSHLTGRRAFWGRDFTVGPEVLDPRPETETLIAAALARPFHRVLDLGTGSGAILVTLLADRPEATGLGVDLSPDALAIASRNANGLGVADRAAFALSDWYAGVTGTFDLIVSNPPYITACEMADLSPEVRNWEPHLALTPGGDGLDAYRAIAPGLGRHLAPGGRVLLEIGPAQGRAVADLLRAAGMQKITILPDLDGRDRVVAGENP
ncbi:peptide chain release factor N(5)-glutamine methyltransferase [Szabonella alba]|uniref:Release factor glutamine methyltransferase n=1 Tax=Szabonella alba TaxID=2804194 RepID=A0A8K0Y179_9RHOB|nr:peptide chain release factor N(5)-glutamine methyltransferase [Szabonella alba]